MLLYIDSLFAEGGEREVRPLHSIPDTINALYLLAMREHRRKAVLVRRDGDRRQLTPDWRFDRSVIRVALQLEQQVQIDQGDRIAVVSDLRPEWPVADLAALGLGAVSVGIPARGTQEQLGTALAESRPRVVFLSPDALERMSSLVDLFDDIELMVLLEGGQTDREKTVPLSTLLDLGGTLDTPERAQQFRSRVTQASADDIAIRHYEFGGSSGTAFVELTQGEIVMRLKDLFLSSPAFEGDVVYAAGPEVTLEARLALYSAIGDGYSAINLATPGRELEELSEVRPDKVVASASVIEAALEVEDATGSAENDPAPGSRVLARLVSGFRRRGRERPADPIREALGGRVRWVGPTTPLDPAVATLLSGAVPVGLSGATAVDPADAGAPT